MPHASLREVCALIGRGGVVLWSDASNNPVLLPDSRTRWEAIWRLRAELVEIAHSHPVGPRGFSHEDETTMRALTEALGRAVRFSVVAPDGMVARIGGEDVHLALEPEWAAWLRRASGMREAP
ncbi:hypothetical protein KRR26_01590 [Corallococcus sp. M34]|uniref:Mov34/MPN/PAD-1 family protein n=1 Tax=Citreicoccus inhibens TaxID=2849499 RepID=UPI001C22B359|nr:Mov34/MPN/PAD-1 family protein [Citreicoccus inhibens]MBU8894275.1 hypothetical protein [Citreicoccus inhibens]